MNDSCQGGKLLSGRSSNFVCIWVHLPACVADKTYPSGASQTKMAILIATKNVL